MSDLEAHDRVVKIHEARKHYLVFGKLPETIHLDDYEKEFLLESLKKK